MDSSKPVYLSKTLWVNLALAVVAFFPGAQAYVVAHPQLAFEVMAGVNFALRLLTKGGVTLS